MQTYRVDLDYESYLFDSKYLENSEKYLKIIREFEYVFFLINQEKCILKNSKNYSKNYLKKLENLSFIIPKLDPYATNEIAWWGNRHDYFLEQKLNSKITSATIALKNGWGFSKGAIVENINEVIKHIEKYQEVETWILKSPYGFSGSGFYQFNSRNLNKFILEKVLNEQRLLEPFHERVFDIGSTLIIQDKKIKRYFMVENFNSVMGSFRGGAACKDPLNFKNYIFKKYNFSLDELEKIILTVGEEYLKLGATGNLQIDSFIYLENNELKLYPLVEVNYRKTMGLVIQSLADKFLESSRIEWIIKTKKEIKEDLGFYDPSFDLTRLSPDDSYFSSYLKKYLL